MKHEDDDSVFLLLSSQVHCKLEYLISFFHFDIPVSQKTQDSKTKSGNNIARDIMAFHERLTKALPLAVTLLILLVDSTAFMVPSVALAPSGGSYRQQGVEKTVGQKSEQRFEECTIDDGIACTGSWRVALNLGREFTTPIWDSYGSSGIRFPVVIPCDFNIDGSVEPRSETVSYVADVSGGSTKPVQGGRWSTKNKNALEFSLSFPEEMRKNDVVIPADSDLSLEVNLVSSQALKELEEAFSEARKEEWKALEKVDEIQAIRDAPKRWNEETQRWEYPRVDEPLSSLFSKHLTAFVKGQERRKKFAEKPRSGVELSKRPGMFPGFPKDDLVYFGTRGVVRNKSKGNMVVGTWTAEPIDGQPASYRNLNR